jgi:(p)ppGpp synthase/HD superfamily hydrolase
MDLIEEAKHFAITVHGEVKRKYTGEPYWTHCEDVAKLVRSVGGDDAMVAAAYLHDTVEDTETELSTIEDKFGADVASLVEQLTDVSVPGDGNREKRKKLDLVHTSLASSRAKTIKLADLISNTTSIVKHDPSFARVYLKEKQKLLVVLAGGNENLLLRAQKILSESLSALGMT